MKIPNILFVPIMVAAVAALSTIVGLIAWWCGAYLPLAWGFFTLIGLFLLGILYIGFRQLYWLVAGKGDYEGRNGFLKRTWTKIFKK